MQKSKVKRGVNHKESYIYQAKTKCAATTNNVLIHCLRHIPLLKGSERLGGEMKWNESGRQKLCSQGYKLYFVDNLTDINVSRVMKST